MYKHSRHIINEEFIKNTINSHIEMYALKEYDAVELFCDNTYLDESLSADTMNDLRHLKSSLKELASVCAKLIIKLSKWGLEKSIKACVYSAKHAKEFYKDNDELCRGFFYSLLFFAVGYGGSQVKEWYNENPVIKGTHITYMKLNGDESLIITKDGNLDIRVVQENEEGIPVVRIGKQKDTSVEKKETYSEKKEAPIHVLKEGEKKNMNMKVSTNMIDALKEVEHFMDHIYDANNPNVKLSQNDLKNMKVDATIGYGHKLSLKERNTWSINKKITRKDADVIFRNDLKETEMIANHLLRKLRYDKKVQYSQPFFNSFCSLLYNMGTGNLIGNNTKGPSEFWKRLNSCRIYANGDINKEDLDFSIAQINQQNITAPGHKFRRRQEYNIMRTYVDRPELYKLKDPSVQY